MFSFIVNNFPAVAVVVPVLLFIAAGIRSAARSRAEAARIAAQEAEKARRSAAALEGRRKAAEKKQAAQAAQAVAAARRAAEQQRKKAERDAARETREAVAAARRAEKLEAARLLAEYTERSLEAARKLRELEAGRDVAQVTAQDPAPEKPGAVRQAPETDAAQTKRPENISHNSPFWGQVVSFTGKLQSMKRAEAIAAVQAAGGRAYADFPAGTTLLVVGTNPGEKKQEKYDRWIGQVKKITEAQFITMLKGA